MFFLIKKISCTKKHKISRKLFPLHIIHFQLTNRLNNRLIDYSVSGLFNNQLVALVDYQLFTQNNRLFLEKHYYRNIKKLFE